MTILSMMWITSVVAAALVFMHCSQDASAWVHHLPRPTTARRMGVSKWTKQHSVRAADSIVAALTAVPADSILTTTPPQILQQRKHFVMREWAKLLTVRRWWPRKVATNPNSSVRRCIANVPSPVSVGHWLFCCMRQHPDACLVHVMLLLGTMEALAGVGLLAPAAEEETV